ncbi:MAG: ribulose-phosphate 3-epimerase [Candidatus Izimaplasma sp.]|nr:ribulose-phosphate 3-epimerase [Candidatus Izimaplasma bacterium]
MIIAPSILSADFGNLQKAIEEIHHTKWLHIDVMDGHFVPNLTIGPVVVKGLRKYTTQILDTHLMIADPLKFAKQFVEAGSDQITFHYEAVEDAKQVIRELKELEIKVGVSIKPKTDVSVIKELIPLVDQVLVMSVEPGFGGQQFLESSLEKIKELNMLKKTQNKNLLIAVDGGINDKTGKLCKEAGADVLIAGSYIFKSDSPKERIQSLQ